MDREKFVIQAAFYEILAMSFLYPTKMLADALVSGEYAKSLDEITTVLKCQSAKQKDVIKQLAIYVGNSADDVLHELRIEYTRLFIGAPKPLVSPYGGICQAKKDGVEPVLFISNETLAVEQFMRSAGIGNPSDIKEPLDHIGSELEFLQYICLVLAGTVIAHKNAEISEAGYYEFVAKHIQNWNKDFAEAIILQSPNPFFQTAAHLLMCI